MNRVLAIEELRQEFNKEKFIRKTQEQIGQGLSVRWCPSIE